MSELKTPKKISEKFLKKIIEASGNPSVLILMRIHTVSDSEVAFSIDSNRSAEAVNRCILQYAAKIAEQNDNNEKII